MYTNSVLPDGPTSRGVATSWRVYLFLLGRFLLSPRWSEPKIERTEERICSS